MQMVQLKNGKKTIVLTNGETMDVDHRKPDMAVLARPAAHGSSAGASKIAELKKRRQVLEASKATPS